jgi:hypothetical protein
VKLKTVNGTEVEIVAMSGNNLVMVNVKGRHGQAQPDARDLVVPKGAVIPEELKELHFWDPDDVKAQKPVIPVDETIEQ